jgi:pyrimidine deaminase RibD-like protein
MPAAAADDFRWEDLDPRLLSPKTSDLADEMHKRVADGERKVEFDTRQSGNAAGYLSRLFDFHERLTDEWAGRLYAAHCDAWIQQNRPISAGFIRAVRDRAMAQLIAARKSSVQAGVCLRGTRIGQQPNSMALGEWNRRIDRLAARWGRKLEADAVASEYRASSDVDDDRRFALMAIEEALKSIPEDDEPHPKVGAVIVKDGKLVSKAHRGENPKSHAEYIALEGKLPDDLVSGATIYTTLEPCTTRNHPKIPCAQRLVERKVARVVIGMLDPNPEIRGRGVQLLREASIETQLFPGDLGAQAEEMNRDFTRAQKQKQTAKKVIGEPGQPINITVSPNISPTISPIQLNAPTTQPEPTMHTKPSPKIIIEPLEPSVRWISPDDHSVWRLGKADAQIAALILPFYLDPIQSDPIYHLEYLRAHLVFTDTSSGKKIRVSHGCWINASLDSLEFRPGETKYLILAIIKEYGSELLAVSTNRTKYDWYKTEGAEEFESVPLPVGDYRLEVVLIWGGGGQFRQTFVLTLDLANLSSQQPS